MNYSTKKFDGKNPFDIHTTGIEFYDQILKNSNQTNELKYNLIYISPSEYFQKCTDILNISKESQLKQMMYDNAIILKLKNILLNNRETFPLTLINNAYSFQEGRHRMFVVGEVLGWDEKFPVMVIDWVDSKNNYESAHFQSQNNLKFIQYIESIKEDSFKEYKNINEIVEFFENKILKDSIFHNIKIQYDSLNSILFKSNDNLYNYKLPIWGFNVKELSNSCMLEQFDNINMLNVLEQFGLKNW